MTLHDQNLLTCTRWRERTRSASIPAWRRPPAIWKRFSLDIGVMVISKTAANYALFDMLHEVIAKSSALIVHSKFARGATRTRLWRARGRTRDRDTASRAAPHDARSGADARQDRVAERRFYYFDVWICDTRQASRMGNGSIERSSGNAAWRSCGSTPVKSVLTSATRHNTSRRTRNSGDAVGSPALCRRKI